MRLLAIGLMAKVETEDRDDAMRRDEDDRDAVGTRRCIADTDRGNIIAIIDRLLSETINTCD